MTSIQQLNIKDEIVNINMTINSGMIDSAAKMRLINKLNKLLLQLNKQRCVMNGVISSRHLLTHAVVIISEFGVVIYIKCVHAVITHKRTTFLSIVMQQVGYVIE